MPQRAGTTPHLVKDMLHNPGSVFYVRRQPAGLGHAVWCARHLVGSEPVAVLCRRPDLGASCVKEMVDTYKGGNMVAVMDVPHEQTGSYGIVKPGADDGRIVQVEVSPKAGSFIRAVQYRRCRPLYHNARGVRDAGCTGTWRGRRDPVDRCPRQADRQSALFRRQVLRRAVRLRLQARSLQANVAFGLNNDAMRDQLRDWLGERLG